MSGHCHHPDAPATARLRRILVIVLIVNAAMFAVEITAGLAAKSVSLQADALDFLGDAATYGITLFVRKRSFRPWNQRGRFHSPRPILAVEGAFPIPSQGPEPDILFRLVGLPVPVVAPAPLGGPDAGPAGGPVNGAGVPGERPPAQGREDVAEPDRDAGSPA